MLYFSKGAIYIISFPGWEEVFLKFPTCGGRKWLNGNDRWRRGVVNGSMWRSGRLKTKGFY